MSLQSDSGFQALQRGDYPAAVSLLEEACRNQPDDYDSNQYLGIAYQYVGRGNEAIQALTNAVSLQPANSSARYNLGVAMENAGHLNEAKQVYEQALSLQPDYPQASQALARLTGAPAIPVVPALPTPSPGQYLPPQSYSAPQQSGYPNSPPSYRTPPPDGAYNQTQTASAPTNSQPLCQVCNGAGPLRSVKFNQNIGLLVMRTSRTVQGDLCEKCAAKNFWQLTLTTFVLGWWGVISFFISPFYIIGNVISYVKGATASGKVLAIAFLLLWLSIFSGLIFLVATSKPEPKQTTDSTLAPSGNDR